MLSGVLCDRAASGVHSSQDLLNHDKQQNSNNPFQNNSPPKSPNSPPKTKTKKIIRKVRRVSKKSKDTAPPFSEKSSTVSEAKTTETNSSSQKREKLPSRDSLHSLLSQNKQSSSANNSSNLHSHRSKTLSAESSNSQHFATGHLHGVSNSQIGKSNSSLDNLVKTTSREGEATGSTKRVTKVIKKKKIIRKVKKKENSSTENSMPTQQQQHQQQQQQHQQQQQPQVQQQLQQETLIQPQPVGQQPRESKGQENEVEALDPFVKEVLNSRAIPKSVKQKIREECWSLFNDPKTPRGVKQCILDNMVAKARQE